MRSRLISVSLLLLLTVFSTSGTTQETGRIFCILVDDIRFLRSDVESAGRLLAVLRDEVLTDGDMVGVVSTGPSAVAVDLRDARDRANLNEAIRRVVNGPSLLGGAVSERTTDAAQLRYHAHVALATVADVVRGLGQIRNRQKYVLVLTSGATSAASLEAVLGAQGATILAGGAATPSIDQVGAAHLLRALSEIASAAKQGNVTIRAIDPKDPASADLLRGLK
jgi:hypothetical protein